MKPLLYIVIITLCFASCNEPSAKFDLELKEENPYILNINNFSYQRVEGSSDLIGEFDELNKAVVEKLKGRAGICEVFLNNNGPYYLGFLTLTKERDWKVFTDRGGVRALLQQQLRYDAVKVEPDTAVVEYDSTYVNPPDTTKVDSTAN
jgi:hypothetical protein